MDTLIHQANKGIKAIANIGSRDRNSAPEPSSAPPICLPEVSPPSRPPPAYYTKNLKDARAAFTADDFLTATSIAYKLLNDQFAPYWAKAQASLIVITYDAYPGNRAAYAEAVGIIESIKHMDQEQVEPNYKTLEMMIKGKRAGSVSSESNKPRLRTQDFHIEEADARRRRAAVDRDIGLALRYMDREQLDGTGGRDKGKAKKAKKERKEKRKEKRKDEHLAAVQERSSEEEESRPQINENPESEQEASKQTSTPQENKAETDEIHEGKPDRPLLEQNVQKESKGEPSKDSEDREDQEDKQIVVETQVVVETQQNSQEEERKAQGAPDKIKFCRDCSCIVS